MSSPKLLNVKVNQKTKQNSKEMKIKVQTSELLIRIYQASSVPCLTWKQTKFPHMDGFGASQWQPQGTYRTGVPEWTRLSRVFVIYTDDQFTQTHQLLQCTQGFTGGSDGKESSCNAEDLGLIPRLGRSPGEGKRLPTPIFWPGYSAQHTILNNRNSKMNKCLSLPSRNSQPTTMYTGKNRSNSESMKYALIICKIKEKDEFRSV